MATPAQIKTAKELGYTGNYEYIWLPCVDCGKERWVRLAKSKPETQRCVPCASRRNIVQAHQRGEDSPSWKGGKRLDSDGYTLVWLSPNSIFYPMVKTGSNVLEHRLVVAQSLGRCLKPQEYVHHKNGIKTDNRLENLELTSPSEHSFSAFRSLQREVVKLQQRVQELECQMQNK